MISTLSLELIAGITLLQAYEESVRLAKLLKVCIMFDFNGITCLAYPDDDISLAEERYKRAETMKFPVCTLIQY